MNTRVEICGLDTSTLPKLKHEEMMELIKKAQSGDEDAQIGRASCRERV